MLSALVRISIKKPIMQLAAVLGTMLRYPICNLLLNPPGFNIGEKYHKEPHC